MYVGDTALGLKVNFNITQTIVKSFRRNIWIENNSRYSFKEACSPLYISSEFLYGSLYIIIRVLWKYLWDKIWWLMQFMNEGSCMKLRLIMSKSFRNSIWYNKDLRFVLCLDVAFIVCFQCCFVCLCGYFSPPKDASTITL